MLLLKKVSADLLNASGRASLVVLAMATGLFAVTSIAATNAVLTRELKRSFAAISPASATIRLWKPAPDSVLQIVANVPGVGIADAGRALATRAQVGKVKLPVRLFTARDYGDISINKLRPLTGPFPPAPGTVLFERAAVRVSGLSLGDTLAVSYDGAAPVPLEFTGTLHDFSQAPAWQEGVIYGYVSRETMAHIAGAAGLTEFRIIVADRGMDVTHIREVAQRVSKELESRGYAVRTVTVPPPGEHPHQSQMNALLGIQQTFGAVALLLSSALIVVLLNAMLIQHRKQIGAMKAIGATLASVMRMYFLWILVLATLAELIALPSGVLAGRAYAAFISDMLNFDVVDQSVPLILLILLILSGVFLPLLVSLVPILRASAMTTRAALQDVALVSPLVPRRVPRPASRAFRILELAIANALRSRARLALVVITLSAGGALFLSSLNLSRSFQGTLAVSIKRMGYDIALGVSDSTPPETVRSQLLAVTGVSSVKTAIVARTIVWDARDPSPNSFTIQSTTAPAIESPLEPLSGRWFQPSDDRAVVANHVWLRDHPQFAVGDSVSLKIGSDSSRWQLIGAVREVMVGPELYAPQSALLRATSHQPRTTSAHVVAADHSLDSTTAVMRRIETNLAHSRITVSGMTNLAAMQQHRDDHVVMIIAFLMTIAALSQLVGALGLATMLSVGVFERSQEIGVMRAVGATRWQLMTLIVVEGAVIAFAGWLGAIILSIPASYALNAAFGRMMLAMPLTMYLSAAAIPLLALVTVIVTLLAAGLPAWRATLLEPRVLLTTT